MSRSSFITYLTLYSFISFLYLLLYLFLMNQVFDRTRFSSKHYLIVLAIASFPCNLASCLSNSSLSKEGFFYTLFIQKETTFWLTQNSFARSAYFSFSTSTLCTIAILSSRVICLCFYDFHFMTGVSSKNSF